MVVARHSWQQATLLLSGMLQKEMSAHSFDLSVLEAIKLTRSSFEYRYMACCSVEICFGSDVRNCTVDNLSVVLHRYCVFGWIGCSSGIRNLIKLGAMVSWNVFYLLMALKQAWNLLLVTEICAPGEPKKSTCF
jgi:hypothetical protein